MRKALLFFAVAALAGITACQKEGVSEKDSLQTEESFHFTSVKPSPEELNSTKTEWTGSSVRWSAGDQIRVAYTVEGTWQGADDDKTTPKLYASTKLSEAKEIAEFDVNDNFKSTAAGKHVFYGLYPGTLVGGTDFPNAPTASVTIPAEQNPGANSFDGVADVMIGVSEEFDAKPSSKETILMSWTRLVALADLTIKNLSINDGEKLEKVTLTAQEGADLVGKHDLDIVTGALSNARGTTNEIVLKADNLTYADKSIKVWASFLPATITELTVTVETDKAYYTSSFTGISREFKRNMRNTLNIGMSSAVRTEKSLKGTAEDPYNATEILEKYASQGSGDEKIYVLGTIKSIDEVSTGYGNATYTLTDGTSDVLIYRGYFINGDRFTSEDQIAIGDEIVVYGKVSIYNEKPQLASGNNIYKFIKRAPYFTAKLSSDKIAYKGGNSITLSIGANVDWTASIDNGASFKIGDGSALATVSGNSDTDIIVVIPENVNGATYTIKLSTTSTDVFGVPAELTITQGDNSETIVKRYVKVTSGTIGGEYLIVRETDKMVYNGSLKNPDDAANYRSSENLTFNYDDWKGYAVTIESYSSGYSIKTAAGYYIGRNANSNGIDNNTSLSANYVNNISFATDGTITILGKGGRKFNYNSSSGKFRYFASSNKTEIYLYKLQEVSK